MKYHGEYVVRLNVEVVVEADSQEEAAEKLKEIHLDADDCEGVMVRGWDTTSVSVALFNGEE